MADYDAIIVGAGLAGSTAAWRLGTAGLNVLVVDRADTPGSKNVTGGRLYAHSLEAVMPGFAGEAPVERKVVRERVSMLSHDGGVTAEYHPHKTGTPASASYTVLRAEFDAWLAGKAEEAGCDVIFPAHADELLMDGGKITGIRAGEDELTAEVVLLADGVNSLLGRKAGLKKELEPHFVAVGCKEIIELPKGLINDRFNVEDGEGVAHLFAGTPSNGLVGGGFLYTNKESLSLGLVISVSSLAASSVSLPDMLNAFKENPTVKPLIAGGRLVEYSAHLVPEGGQNMIPVLSKDNLLLAGDAAGFCLNMGYTVRGMDYAIASGSLAAETIIEAKERNDFSDAVLSGYRKRLENSFVLRDMQTHKNAPAFIEHTGRLYKEYPELVSGIFSDVFTVDGTPSRLTWKKALPRLRKAGLFTLLKDGLKGAGAI